MMEASISKERMKNETLKPQVIATWRSCDLAATESGVNCTWEIKIFEELEFDR